MQPCWLFAVAVAIVVVAVVAGVYVVSFACFVSQRLEISENSSHLWHEVGLGAKQAKRICILCWRLNHAHRFWPSLLLLPLLLSVWASVCLLRCVIDEIFAHGSLQLVWVAVIDGRETLCKRNIWGIPSVEWRNKRLRQQTWPNAQLLRICSYIVRDIWSAL